MEESASLTAEEVARKRRSGMFFDDEIAPAELLDISRSDKAQESRRRRRPATQQPAVVLPDFEDELKDEIKTARRAPPTLHPNGTVHFKLEDAASTSPGQRVNSSAGVQEQGSKEEGKPRRFGSQISDIRGGFAVNLGAIEEDIVTLSNDDLRASIRKTTLRNKNDGETHAQMSSRLYVEDSEKGKFYTLSKRPKEWDVATMDEPTQDPVDKPIDIPTTTWSSDVSVYRTIRHFFLFSHGFLAGLALLHCVLLYALAPARQNDWLFFVRPFTRIAIVFRTLYHVLITLCAVSGLCRMDILSGFDKRLVTENLDAVIGTILYFVAAVLTHLCDSTVSRLMLDWHTTPDVISSEVQEELVRFRIMDAVRTSCVCAAWIITAFRWKHDRFKRYLHVKSA
ncbi:hypothetical protein RvY_14126 [Ramazzottius varieornatus]|uniref:Transmembrane protein 237 n=1 Tax=Ramazzottius varieornatus TaxID=947166 RepID=A0A1D1VU51_RAMVA|nr:hypothetical protein RvY_14126 [Ramazzottius varieornatus]